MPRPLLGLLLLAALSALASCDRGLLAPPTLEPLDVTAEGPWLRDRRGRVVLLRGVTLGVLGPELFVDHPGGITEGDFAGLERAGFNVVRVLLPWRALEPEPGTTDRGYLVTRLNPVLRLAAKYGMLGIVGLAGHPGARPGLVCGLLESDRREPTSPRAQFLARWRDVIRLYAADRRVVGWDLLEEPRDVTCSDGSSGALLPGLYRDARRLLRQNGARQALFFDPTVRRDEALPAEVPGPRAAEVFAPHLFSQAFGEPPGSSGAVLQRAYAQAVTLARSRAVVFFAGEIGADEPPGRAGFRGASGPFIAASLDELDRHLAGGTIAVAPGRRPLSPETAPELRPALRPWARRIAGIPTAMRFDRASRSYLLAFRDDPERRVADPTEIFVPPELYPEGFSVQVLPSGRWHHDPHSRRLLVYRGDSAGHAVRIVPQGADPSPPPAD